MSVHSRACGAPKAFEACIQEGAMSLRCARQQIANPHRGRFLFRYRSQNEAQPLARAGQLSALSRPDLAEQVGTKHRVPAVQEIERLLPGEKDQNAWRQ